jgi:16S rRNA (adenine1518-N6/adenine1519-N6)-dimethyltransferase
MFRAVVRAAFGARRKTLRNALKALMSNPAAAASVESTGIDLRRRGETLRVDELAAIAIALENKPS